MGTPTHVAPNATGTSLGDREPRVGQDRNAAVMRCYKVGMGQGWGRERGWDGEWGRMGQGIGEG